MTNYKGYPTFHEIEDVTLRCWNRCAMVFNIREDKGEEEAQNYLEQFDQKVYKQMMFMFNYIQLRGYETAKREVHRGLVEKS